MVLHVQLVADILIKVNFNLRDLVFAYYCLYHYYYSPCNVVILTKTTISKRLSSLNSEGVTF